MSQDKPYGVGAFISDFIITMIFLAIILTIGIGLLYFLFGW